MIPNIYGSLDDLRSALALLADVSTQYCAASTIRIAPRVSDHTDRVRQGVVKPIVHTVPLEKIDETINALRASAVLGRRVIVPGLCE